VKSLERPCQRLRNRTQGDAEGLGNLAIAQTLRTHVQAAAVLFGQGVENGQKFPLPLLRVYLLLGIRARVDLPVKETVIRRKGCASCRVPVLQTEIVSDAKYPAAQIVPISTQPQMLEKREKYLLDNFLAIMIAHANGVQITEQPGSGVLKQTQNFLL
jgi:hypothetical protein